MVNEKVKDMNIDGGQCRQVRVVAIKTGRTALTGGNSGVLLTCQDRKQERRARKIHDGDEKDISCRSMETPRRRTGKIGHGHGRVCGGGSKRQVQEGITDREGRITMKTRHPVVSRSKRPAHQ